jgi:hypothetical protein
MSSVTLIVEDGTVVTGANTYYSLASADDYFTQRGNTTWIGYGNDAKTYALIKACQYMENLDWNGVATLEDQELVWPRIGMIYSSGYSVESSEIPRNIKWAQAELAYRYIVDGDVEPDITTGEKNVIMEKVDVIEIRYSGTGKSTFKTYQRVDNLLSPFLKYGGGGGTIIELIRA